jgi:hypothetical protein
VSDARQPPIAASRPTRRILQGRRRNRAPILAPSPCGLANKESVGWVYAACGAGQLGPFEVSPSPRAAAPARRRQLMGFARPHRQPHTSRRAGQGCSRSVQLPPGPFKLSRGYFVPSRALAPFSAMNGSGATRVRVEREQETPASAVGAGRGNFKGPRVVAVHPSPARSLNPAVPVCVLCRPGVLKALSPRACSGASSDVGRPPPGINVPLRRFVSQPQSPYNCGPGDAISASPLWLWVANRGAAASRRPPSAARCGLFHRFKSGPRLSRWEAAGQPCSLASRLAPR